MSRPLRVAFLARSLNVGGAERQIATLVGALDRSRFEPRVFCFYGGGPFDEEIRARGVEVVTLGKSGRWHVLTFLLRLIRELRRFETDVVHSFLSVPNVLALVIRPFLRGARVVWGIRSAYRTGEYHDAFVRFSFTLERLLSRFADAIVANSEAAKANCIARGYSMRKLVVIPNGVDTERFRPDAAARSRVRAELGITGNAIGIVARLDRVKDHETFLRAAALLRAQRSDVQFVIVGSGSENRWRELEALGGPHVLWTGTRRDIPDVLNALDILTSTSTYESFPNAIVEAMACGVPCVVTDAGDSAAIVGNTGIVVPTGDPARLVEAWSTMLADGRAERGAAARARVVEQYSLAMLLRRTEDILGAV